MTYQQALDGIHSRRTFSKGGPTLSRIRRLMDALGNCQEQYKVVHIAGTNGKGSVSAMTAAALRACGYRVGLFTSPYLVDFRERIQIDGSMISREELISCYEMVMEQESRLERQGFEPVNEFELVTAVGFLAFSRAKVDYAVLEVGLGGRTDPTNLVKHPAACCITSISLDHTAVLGDTVAQIAGEKAGIIKPGCPVVFAEQTPEALAVLLEAAGEKGAPIYQAEPVIPLSQTRAGSRFLCGDTELCIPLLGDFQMENAAAVWKLCKVLRLPEERVKAALETVSWPGRLQYSKGTPALLVDAGHNPGGIEALCRGLDQLFSGQRIVTVMTMLGDKDFSACIPMVAKRSALLIGSSVGLPRSLSPRQVAQAASPFCPTLTADTVADALTLARANAERGDLILVCGSVYGAGEALSLLSQTN